MIFENKDFSGKILELHKTSDDAPDKVLNVELNAVKHYEHEFIKNMTTGINPVELSYMLIATIHAANAILDDVLTTYEPIQGRINALRELSGLLTKPQVGHISIDESKLKRSGNSAEGR